MRDELIAWRQHLKWTQREAAEYLDVPYRTYVGWEQGHRTIHNPGPVRRLVRLVYWPSEAKDIMTKTAKQRWGVSS